jgi:hypothetical protein
MLSRIRLTCAFCCLLMSLADSFASAADLSTALSRGEGGVFVKLKGSSDSVPYSREYEFKEGIFLTPERFKANDPIPRSAIVTAIPASQADFLQEVMSYKTITYKDASGTEQKLETATAWGFCQNRTIYLNFNKEFNRVNLIGKVFHMVAPVTTFVARDPMNYNYAINTTQEELRQFIYDTQTNKIMDFDLKTMEPILQRDKELYDEFMKLSKRKKKEAIFIYLRKYNEKHPLMLADK